MIVFSPSASDNLSQQNSLQALVTEQSLMVFHQSHQHFNILFARCFSMMHFLLLPALHLGVMRKPFLFFKEALLIIEQACAQHIPYILISKFNLFIFMALTVKLGFILSPYFMFLIYHTFLSHFFLLLLFFNPSIQFSSVAQSCPALWDPMNRSTPGLPVHHHLLEFTQTHIHRVSDAIQPSHPLSSPSPPAPNLSQHQGLFQ